MTHHQPPPLDPTLPAPRRRRAVRVARGMGYLTGWLLFSAFVMAVFAGIAALALTERNLIVPEWVTVRIERRINAELQQGKVDLGEIGMIVDRRGVPRLTLYDVGVFDGNGSALAQLNQVRAVFEPKALITGRIVPRSLTLDGAQITLRRAVDGTFSLSFGPGGAAFPGMSAVLAQVETILEQPLFANMRMAAVRDLTLSVEDARTARVWQIVGGQARLMQTPDSLDLTLLADVFNGTDNLAQLQLSARHQRRGGGAAITANITDVAAQDIALQSPALAFLGVLDAPISGALRATLNADGTLDELAGTLDIAAGAVQPRPETAPIAFDTARSYFTYRPADQKITFSEIEVESADLTASITGHAYLRDLSEQGFPRALVAQLRLDQLRLAPLGVFEDTLEFRQGAADLRLRLNPFTLDIGQLVLTEPGTGDSPRKYSATGRISADPEGWNVALDLDVPEIPTARALTLWPVPVAAKTRAWLGKNVSSGTLFNITGALRKRPTQRPDLAASFAFRDGSLSFLPEMLPMENASGYASIHRGRFAITMDSGVVVAPEGGEIDVGGSVLVVPNTREKPALGEFSLKSDSTLTAVLSLLNQPPLRILRNSPRGPDLADARAQMTTDLALRFQKGNTLADIDYASSGTLTDFRADGLVANRTLAADRLTVDVSPAAVVVSGTASIDKVPLTGRWRMGLAPEDRGTSRVQGRVELSSDTITRLGIGLPNGMVTGRGQGDITVDLVTGQPPKLRLSSDLAGVGLALGALSWAKPAGAKGDLTLNVTLGAPPVVNNLTVNAGGLQAAGRVSLAPGGGLDAAVFDRVRLSGWFDAPVTISGRGKGAPPAIAVRGGTLDFRRAGFAKGGGGSGGARGPISIALDQLVMTEGITLTDFTGRLDAGRATNGSFVARVNGGTAVKGELVSTAQGISLRLISADAGGVMRDAGLVKNGYDGPLEVILRPTGARGTYDGTLNIGRLRIRGAPAIADLLGAISVVGLLEQLNGDGLVFEQTQAAFRLTPSQVIVYQSSATGASLGISMDGIYDLASKQINMQGVISPIYLLNRIGSIFTRQGEGLFGFNFGLTGPVAKPAVSVNPLSILTPGMFRDIFRRPAPQR
ncbi:hypothetical protein [Oceaniglobus ichthyenteri]|uniref:hypothetical protein n=1 Tax=Oceaniglobus ichthyenteri TaxID=2136177 RepID=UPI000D34D017|nr:hypothetical protein [Oceaniglobus ichthyenteri]